MSFAGKVWRLLVGIKDALALLFLLLFFTVLFAALSSRPNPALVQEGALLLDLNGSIVEEPALADPLALLLSGSVPTREYRARNLVRAIDEAASDDRIKAIAMDLTTFTGGGNVNVKEVAEALRRFKTSDKPILAFSVAYIDDALTLAAEADEIWIDPMGGPAIRGPGGNIMFYADALERFNITANVYQVGQYKGTGEPYMNSQMSPELRENLEGYVSQIWEEYVARISHARPEFDVGAVTTNLLEGLAQNNGDMAQLAVASGLADTIGTRDEWAQKVAEVAGEDNWSSGPDSFAATDLDPWLAEIGPESAPASAFGSRRRQIGVITVSGEINDSNAGPGQAGAARISSILDDALEDDLAALVVRVNSPGGTVTGSETIRRAVERHADKGIPIAISMGNAAASGGYWIATSGDRIFAEPETITGSIGVVLVLPTFEGILNEYGVTADRIETTPFSGQPDLLGGLTGETDALLQAQTESIYTRFLGMVMEARDLSPLQAAEVAEGRVWTGGTARQLGLIDQFGDLDTALEWAATEAGLAEDEWQPYFLTSPPDPWAALFGGVPAPAANSGPELLSVEAVLAAERNASVERVLRDFDRLFETNGAQALCLPCVADSGAAPPQNRNAQLSWWQIISRSVALQ